MNDYNEKREKKGGFWSALAGLVRGGSSAAGSGFGSAGSAAGGLGGGRDLRIVGQADVVVDAEVDDLTLLDASRAAGAALVDAEIRVVAGHHPQQAFLTLQLSVLGELGEIVVLGRDLAGGDSGPGSVDQVLLYRPGQVPQRLCLAEHRVGQAAAESLLQHGREFQALQ